MGEVQCALACTEPDEVRDPGACACISMEEYVRMTSHNLDENCRPKPEDTRSSIDVTHVTG